MPYVIKHKQKSRYVGKCKKADYDEDKLVSIDYAKFYSSEKGARLGMLSWCRYSVSRLIDKHKLNQFEIIKY